MSKSKQENNIDPAAAGAQEEEKRKKLLFSFSAKFIAAVGSTEGSRNSCLLTDAIALFDKDWDEGINFYVREIGCRNIPELVQLLENKVNIFMDAQRRWWVNVLRTDVNGHILDRVDSANERNRIENYNRSTGARSTTNYIPLKNEQAFRDFRRGRLSLSNGYLEPNPFNRSAPPAPLRSQNRSVPPAPARNQKQAAPPVPAQNTNQTKNSNRAARRSRQRQQYERPRAFSSSAANFGSNNSSNTSLFNSSMPPQPQPLFPKKTPEPVQKHQPSKTNNTALIQSNDNKAEEVAAQLISVFSNSSLGPANPVAINGVNVPAVLPVKSSAPTACISNDSIDSSRAEPAATNEVNSTVNIAQQDEKEKKAKFAEEMLASENEFSDRLDQLQISANDQPVAPTKPAFSLPMKRTIEMDTSILDALEAPLPGADDDIEIKAPLPHVDDDIDEIEVDW